MQPLLRATTGLTALCCVACPNPGTDAAATDSSVGLDSGVDVGDSGETTPPEVISVDPPDGMTYVFAATPLTVTFSEAMDATTLAGAITVTANGSPVPGTVATLAATATFTPTMPLRFDAAITATIATAATDLAGNALQSPYVWSFDTGPIPIAGGGWHSVALLDDGTVWTWGDNWSGQLGDGTSDPRATVIQVCDAGAVAPCTSFLSDVVQVAAGNEHTVALKRDGTVWAWGLGTHLGDGTINDSPTPVQVMGPGGAGFLTGIVAIAAEYYQTFALRNDGLVWAFGENTEDQLGDGSGTDQLSPVPVCDVGQSYPCPMFLRDVVAIAAGGLHTLALKSDGTVLAWGFDPYGELGDGPGAIDQPIPVPVLGAGGVGFLSDIRTIDASFYLSAALANDGTVYTWGGNYEGQLGNGDAARADSDVPVRVCASGGTLPCSSFLSGILHIDAGYDHVVALADDGGVWTWGQGLFGELGDDNTPADALAPVQVVGAGGTGLLMNVVGIATTDYYTSLALLADGTVWGWGWNDNGELLMDTGETCDAGSRACASTPIQIGTLDLFP